MAPERFQSFGLLPGLDPFGDNLGFEMAGQGDNRRDHRGVVGAGAHLADKSPVNLQAVEWQVGQVGQRGVAGTEVIDGDMDPEPAQLAQGLGHLLRLADQP